MSFSFEHSGQIAFDASDFEQSSWTNLLQTEHFIKSKQGISNAICPLCSNEKDISIERSQAAESLKRQATRMRNRSEKILTEVEIGQNKLRLMPLTLSKVREQIYCKRNIS
jgi:hypothetical protein